MSDFLYLIFTIIPSHDPSNWFVLIILASFTSAESLEEAMNERKILIYLFLSYFIKVYIGTTVIKSLFFRIFNDKRNYILANWSKIY